MRLPEGAKIVNGRAVRADGTTSALNSQSARETGGLSEGATREVAQSQDSFTRSGAFKLVGQTPGIGFEKHPAGTAKRILPGMYVQFNLHYQPSGRAEKDHSRLGLWFAKQPPKYEMLTKGVTDNVFIEGKELSVDGSPATDPRPPKPMIKVLILALLLFQQAPQQPSHPTEPTD